MGCNASTNKLHEESTSVIKRSVEVAPKNLEDVHQVISNHDDLIAKVMKSQILQKDDGNDL